MLQHIDMTVKPSSTGHTYRLTSQVPMVKQTHIPTHTQGAVETAWFLSMLLSLRGTIPNRTVLVRVTDLSLPPD